MSDTVERLKAALADRYRIERELGSGGMATAYLAHDLKHDRKVAVKVLRPELTATLGAERSLREISIAAKLTHPHILALYDGEQADGAGALFSSPSAAKLFVTLGLCSTNCSTYCKATAVSPGAVAMHAE